MGGVCTCVCCLWYVCACVCGGGWVVSGWRARTRVCVCVHLHFNLYVLFLCREKALSATGGNDVQVAADWWVLVTCMSHDIAMITPIFKAMQDAYMYVSQSHTDCGVNTWSLITMENRGLCHIFQNDRSFSNTLTEYWCHLPDVAARWVCCIQCSVFIPLWRLRGKEE